MQKRCRIEIENGFRFRMIARLHAVACEREHIAHAECRSAEHIALNGNAVVIATRDLQNR